MAWYDDDEEELVDGDDTNPPTPISFSDWRAMLSEGGWEVPENIDQGACLVKHPGTGTKYCIITDKGTCKIHKGKWIGGICPF